MSAQGETDPFMSHLPVPSGRKAGILPVMDEYSEGDRDG